jgi:hypothetical protein
VSISSQSLSRFVDNTWGAHLLLLDVSRRSADNIARRRTWPENSRGAMLRYAWLQAERQPQEEARLITALEDIVPRSKLLGEVDDQLSERFKTVERDYPVDYDRHVPDSLRNLQLVGMATE